MNNREYYPDYKIGERVLDLMQKKNESAVVIGMLIGRDRKTVYGRCNGTTSWTVDEVQLLCRHFKVSADYLIFGKE